MQTAAGWDSFGLNRFGDMQGNEAVASIRLSHQQAQPTMNDSITDVIDLCSR
jgi:hypothetical protein